MSHRRLFSVIFSVLVLIGCDTVAPIDPQTTSSFVLNDPTTKIIWETQIDHLNIDSMSYRLPILNDRIFLPSHSLLGAQLLVLDALSGQIVKQVRYNGIFEMWAFDNSLYLIHDDTKLTTLDVSLNILSEYNTIDRRMRSGLPHNDLYYIFTEENYIYNVFSMTTMQIIESKTSTIIIDKKGRASLINRDGENIVHDSTSNTDIYLSRGRSVWGKLFDDYAWIWSQGTLVRFNIETREIDARFFVGRGEFFIGNQILAIYQNSEILLIDPLSLSEIDQISLPEENFELNMISVTNDRIYMLWNDDKIVAIEYE